jgi:hypothetical protein
MVPRSMRRFYQTKVLVDTLVSVRVYFKGLGRGRRFETNTKVPGDTFVQLLAGHAFGVIALCWSRRQPRMR